MATTHRDPGAGLTTMTLWVAGLALAATAPGAMAQMQQPTPGEQAPLPVPVTAPPQPRNQFVQATLNAQAYATTSANPTPGASGKSDLILSVTPGISVVSRGANTSVEGQWQLNALHYTRGTQPNAVLPSGQLNLHADAVRKQAGIDAALVSSQVRSSVTATASDTPNTADTYTNSLIRLSPYVDKQVDENTQALLRLNRSLLHTSQAGTGTGLADRPDSRLIDDTARLSRRATPLGYAVEWRRQQSSVSGDGNPALNERRARATALYAPTPELNLGYIVGKGRNQIGVERINETTHGVQLQWRPTERTVLDTEVENRYFGRAWQVQASHRTPFISLGLNAERSVSTYVSNLGVLGQGIGQGGSLTGMYDALLTTRIPDPIERRKAVEDLIAKRNLAGQVTTAGDVYDVSAQILQTTSARIAFMGRRDVLTFVGGASRTSPVTSGSGVSAIALTSVAHTKSQYLDAQLNHQLTPYSTVSGGLRWDRASSTAPTAGLSTQSRDFTMRAALNTVLNPDTTATMGLKRQITHNPSNTSNGESAMYVGLGYRF